MQSVDDHPVLRSWGLSADMCRESQEVIREGLCRRGGVTMCRNTRRSENLISRGGRASTGVEQAASHKPLANVSSGEKPWEGSSGVGEAVAQRGASPCKRNPSIGQDLLSPGPSPGCTQPGKAKLLGYLISSSFNFILDEMELVKPVVICDSLSCK